MTKMDWDQAWLVEMSSQQPQRLRESLDIFECRAAQDLPVEHVVELVAVFTSIVLKVPREETVTGCLID